MKYLFLLSLLVFLGSCAVPAPKANPEHTGVDPRLQDYVSEFKEFAANRNIHFERIVTVGFKQIKEGDVISRTIGICTYGFNGIRFREIDIDSEFWDNESELRKKALIFHELVHCYCTRNHTYGQKANIMYPKSNLEKFIASLTPADSNNPSHLEDGCPSSLMYPNVISDQCMWEHYDYYIEEMFNGCRPW